MSPLSAMAPCRLLRGEKLRIVGTASSGHTNKSYRFSIVVDLTKRSYTYEDTHDDK